jgi:hypothetical protein
MGTTSLADSWLSGPNFEQEPLQQELASHDTQYRHWNLAVISAPIEDRDRWFATSERYIPVPSAIASYSDHSVKVAR